MTSPGASRRPEPAGSSKKFISLSIIHGSEFLCLLFKHNWLCLLPFRRSSCKVSVNYLCVPFAEHLEQPTSVDQCVYWVPLVGSFDGIFKPVGDAWICQDFFESHTEAYVGGICGDPVTESKRKSRYVARPAKHWIRVLY